MVQKVKASLAIVTTCVLLYFASMAGVTAAEVGSAAAEDMSTYATISLEACAVRVDMEALEQSSGFHALSSISAEQVLSRVEADEAEVISSVKVLVAEGAVGEMATEKNAREKVEDRAEEVGEQAEWETAASFWAEVIEVDGGRVEVEFDFKQIFSKHGALEESDAEREEEHAKVFEASSRLGLPAGRPIIVGAKKNEDGAMFLILYADI